MSSSSEDSQRYVYRGQVVEKKPFQIQDVFLAIVNVLRLFFMTIFTSRQQSAHVDEYRESKRGGHTWGSGGNRVTGFAKPASAGCSGAGG